MKKDELILRLGRKTASKTLTIIVDEDIDEKLNKASKLLNMSKSAVIRAILGPVLEKNYGNLVPTPAEKMAAALTKKIAVKAGKKA